MNNKKFYYKTILYILMAFILLIISYLVYNYITNYMVKESIDLDIIENNNSDNTFVHFNGYSYTLPNKVFYKIDNDATLQLLNNEAKWGAWIIIQDENDYNYDTFKDYDILEKNLKKHSDVRNMKVNNYDNYNLISFEAHGENSNSILAYMNAYDNYVYEINLFSNNDTSFNYDALDKVVNILKTAKKVN